MTAIFLHIYYHSLWPSMLDILRRCPFEFNLYVNLVQGHADSLKEEIVKEFPDAIVNISPNQGMDPGGQLRTLNYWLTNGKGEDFIVFLHDKKNDSLRELMSSIITDRAGDAIESFKNPEIGMVGVKK